MTPTSFILFIIIAGGSMLIQLVFFLLYRSRNTWRYSKQVIATIHQIQIWLDGWYVAASWTDVLTGQQHIFYSKRIDTCLEQKVGDSVIVDVDPEDFERYHMQL
jgi:hypothetical protein